MIYDLDNMMVDIIDNWDNSIFFYGGDTSLAGYTEEQYKLLGYVDKQDFQTDDFFDEFSFSNRVQGNNRGIGQILNDDDKHVLANYANVLFNTVEGKKTIYRYMLKLALHVNRYRYLKTRDISINKTNKINRPKIKKHYTKKQKEEKLKKLAKEMIALAGGRNAITPELENIIQNPENYIPRTRYKISQPKQVIKDYLFGLKINKKDEIQDFIKKID